MRSRASASCIRAIGRSNALSSSACDVDGIAPTSAPDMPTQSRGASTPRVRASSSAVSIRTDPSRWRCSSAFGIDSMSRRRACRATASSRSGVSSAVIRRCYDSAASTVEPPRPHRPHRHRPEDPLRRIRDLTRQAAATLIWLAAALAIALGAAGIVAGMDTPAADGSDRTGRTRQGDAIVDRHLDAIEIDLRDLSVAIGSLNDQARAIMASLANNDPAAADAATALGTGLVADIADARRPDPGRPDQRADRRDPGGRVRADAGDRRALRRVCRRPRVEPRHHRVVDPARRSDR